MDAAFPALTEPSRLWSESDVFSVPCPVPAVPGVYAWYFREIPREVDATGCIRRGDSTLLYVGISPKAPPAAGQPSKQSLRSRIRYHYHGNCVRLLVRGRRAVARRNGIDDRTRSAVES
jgi:GIY-YIG catalytic domain-containing protein